METHSRDFGYLHIENMVYQALDHYGNSLVNYSMIEDGCEANALIQFKSMSNYNYQIRT